MAGIRFEVAQVPAGEPGPQGVDRWRISTPEKRVVLYRLPIERLRTCTATTSGTGGRLSRVACFARWLSYSGKTLGMVALKARG